MRPSIALPTGPYDWHPEHIPASTFHARLAQFRGIMREHDVEHAVVHGNGFDHAALHWLTHFTPKLGPACALVPMDGPPKVLFAGGPGMKPSAQRLTWINDVVALKGIGKDLAAWLGESGAGSRPVGLVEGDAMLRGDWNEMAKVAGSLVALDEPLSGLRQADPIVEADRARAQTALDVAITELSRQAQRGADIRRLILGVERAAYTAGVQDIRILVGRGANSPPTTPPDTGMTLSGPTWFSISVRHSGAWAERRLLQNLP